MTAALTTDTATRPLPIVAFANTLWDSLWMNRQHLLSRLASRGHPVIYSNGTVHYSQLAHVPFLQKIERRDGVLVARSGYVLPRTYRHSCFNRHSIGHHVRMLKRALGLDTGQPFIGMCFDPNLLDFHDALAAPVTAFHIYDAYNHMDESIVDFDHMRRRIRAFDLVTGSSRQMYQDVVGYPPAEHEVISNGVDFRATLANLERPSATADRIRTLPGPRIGYIGSINTKVHFSLIRELAVARPDASFILVGPVRVAVLNKHPEEWAVFQALTSLPNVHVLAEIHRDEVPAVMNAMDINCLFFRVDRSDWVSAGYPIKLHEYLAVGHPVISTGIGVIREQFSSVVSVCDTTAEWLAGIDEAIAQGDSAVAVARRRHVAADNDWNRRLEQMETLLTAVVARKIPERGRRSDVKR